MSDLVAAIPAGGYAEAAFARTLGAPTKALARLGGQTLLERTIDAVRAAGASRVIVVGGRAIRAVASDRADRILDDDADGAVNIARAASEAEGSALLLIACDLPFVTGASIAAFVARARHHDVALPVAEAIAYERRFAGAPPHVVRLGRDRIANGSAVYFSPGVVTRTLPLARRLFVARKSLISMASILGPRLLARFLFGRLSVSDIERRGRELLNLDVRAIRDSSPELCLDIDTIADWEFASRHHTG